MAGCLIIGIGNTLMKDDGVGVHAVRFMRHMLPRDVEVIEGAIYSVELMSCMDGCGKAFFIDGIDAGEEPGAIFKFSPDDLKGSINAPMSVHDYGLLDLIRDAKLLGQCPEDVTLFTVQVKEVGLGEDLSTEVEQALPKLADLVIKELEAEL